MSLLWTNEPRCVVCRRQPAPDESPACARCQPFLAVREEVRVAIREATESAEADDLVNEFPVLPANFV